MIPVVQFNVAASPQSAFTVPATFPVAGTNALVTVNGVSVAFSRTNSTTITLRAAAREGSIVNFFQTDTPSAVGLVWVGVLDFPSVAAQASQSLTCAVQGAEVGDIVSLGLPAAPAAGLVFNAFVSAAGTITVRCTNVTIAAIDPASATYRVRAVKA